MRAWNERLVLSLVRREGALAKSDIARMTGLSAQTVSVIMRALEQDGFLLRGEPVRGKIGQPSVPMRLAPEGALFLGLKLGRRSADLTLVDFLGRVRATRRRLWRYPTPDAVVDFVTQALPEVMADLTPTVRARIGGMGVAMPFQLWNWVDFIGAPQNEMDAWRHRDIGAELSAMTGMPVHVQNDATAACGAELVFGTGDRPRDFLYFYFGFFIGGGLVLNGQLYTGRTGNAAGVGPMPVPGPDGQMRRLLDVASLFTLAQAMDAAGEKSDSLWHDPHDWQVGADVLDAWIADTGQALAAAVMSATGLLELEAVMFDGWMPAGVRAAVTQATAAAFARLDQAGISTPAFREGTVGPEARALGAAAVPLSLRYMIDGWTG
ncbi:MAG: ROK family transcriptional regulator [Paracoccaceae bacterium]|nr:MAG: ROK family transcriptional regulator [Paracoccaceae bacterium]